MKRTIFILSFILGQLYCSGQSLVFNHLQKKDGLSLNSIVAVTQDSRGFMWFGSTAGLNRYDGVNFYIYKSSPTDTTTLSDDYVRSLYSDSKGTLWIGTANGLNKFDPRKNSFKRIYLNQPGSIHPYNSIRVIYEDKHAHLWIGTNQGLYLLTNPATSTFTSAQQLGLPAEMANSRVLSIYEDDDGFLWLGTSKGLIRLRFDKRLYAIKKFTKDNTLTSISSNSVTAITEDLQKNLWVGTENGGLNLFSRASETFSRYLHEDGNSNTLVYNDIRSMVRCKSGELWIGTQDGISVLNPATKQFRNFQHSSANDESLKQNSIYSIHEDINGSVWIGTYYGGVNVVYAYPTNFNIMQYSEKSPSITANVISSILEDKANNLWIGTEGGGLNYFNHETKKFKAYTFKAGDAGSLGSNLVRVVYKDKKDRIWVGTHGGGLNLYNPASDNFERISTRGNDLDSIHSEITAIIQDANGVLWVGGSSGLRLLDNNNDDLKPYLGYDKAKILKNENIVFLFEDSKKNVWVAASGGLYLYSEQLNTLRSIRLTKNSHSVVTNSSPVNCIQQDTKGNIWIGLSDGGLAMYDETKAALTTTYTTKDGLSDNNVVGIIEDNFGHLWISTSNGLSKLDLKSKTFQTYTTSDGLAGNDFNNNSFFIDKHGEIFLGGFDGITHFFPNEIQENNYRAPIVFTRLKLFNSAVSVNSADHLLQQDMSFTKKLVFKHDQNIIAIDFALLNYIKAKKNKYFYKLKGINDQWIQTTAPSVNYTNLPAGTYTLLVKGANNDGVWSKPISIQIEILPPFWATWWAYCLYTAILGIILFFITRFFYLRKLLVKDAELHQIKLTFFTNVSHEIRTHLTLIMASIEKLLDARQNNTEINKPIANVKNNADRLLKLVSELLDFRKAESKNLKLHVAAYDLIEFIGGIYNSFEELSSKKKIQFEILHDGSPLLVYFDKEQLEKVFFNIISNAFKFTPAGGSITVKIERQATRALVSVVDTGRGIAAEYQDRLFNNFFQVDDHNIQNTGYGIGLALSKNIVELHHGDIAVNSILAEGGLPGRTTFTVMLLLGTKHFKHSDYLQQAAEYQLMNNDEEKRSVESKSPGITSDEHDTLKEYSVLIVEDNPDIRALIKESFENEYHILTATNGLEGYHKACEKIPDLIISDVMMPKMDGVTLCNKLKTDERTSHIPVILLTAKSSETDQISGLTGGADAYLTKPFKVKILQLQVQNLLLGREAMRKKFSRTMTLEPNQIIVDSIDEKFLSRLIEIIEDCMDDEGFGVDMLSEKVGMSQSVLYKKLKALTDMSINDFSKSIRLKRAAQLLKAKRHTVYEVGYMVGFTDRKYFSKEFKKQFGKTPTDYVDDEK